MEQSLVQRAVQGASHLLNALLAGGVQVRRADVADEKGIAGEHEPRFLTAAMVRHEVGVVRGRDRGHDRLDHGIAELERLTVAELRCSNCACESSGM